MSLIPVIVESPHKAEVIQAILDKHYPGSFKLLASKGHICDLPQHSLGFEPPEFIPAYEVTPYKKKLLTNLKDWCRNADTVYLASDLDREGEAIAYHLKTFLGLDDDQYVRIRFNEITETAIKNALEDPDDIDMDRVASQETRRMLDRMIGYQLYMPISNALFMKAPVGRSQTSCLLLIYLNHINKRDFKPLDHYKLNAVVDNEWKMNWEFKNWLSEDQIKEKGMYWTDFSAINQLGKQLTNQKVKITSVDKQQSISNPPPPLITATMQSLAAAKLDISLGETMKIAQRLYEAGLISYHRTDSTALSDDAYAQIEKVAKAKKVNATRNISKVDNSAQEAHECIRPTDFSVYDLENVTEKELELYRLIWMRAFVSQMEPAVYDVVTVSAEKDVVITLDDGTEKNLVAHLSTTKKTMVSPGWTATASKLALNLDLINYSDDDNQESKDVDGIIPSDIAEGDEYTITAANVVSAKTKPASPYTVSSLVSALKRYGIGRPSTYQSIYDRLIDHEYIKLKKKSIEITDRGILLIDSLQHKFSFVDLNYSKNMEDILDQIASGAVDFKEQLNEFHNELHEQLDHFLDQQKEALPFHACSECESGRYMPRIALRYNKVQKYWSCDNDNCKHSRPNKVDKGENMPGQPTVREITTHKCSVCDYPLTYVVGEGFKYFVCSQSALEDAPCTARYSLIADPDNPDTFLPDYDKYKRNHTYKCQVEGCGGWLSEIKGNKNGSPYHFFVCEHAGKKSFGKKCKSSSLGVLSDNSPDYEAREKVEATEYECLCGSPNKLNLHTYKKKDGSYYSKYICPVKKCSAEYQLLNDDSGAPDLHKMNYRTGKEHKCLNCGENMPQFDKPKADGSSYLKWECLSCFSEFYHDDDTDGPAKPREKNPLPSAKSAKSRGKGTVKVKTPTAAK